MLAAIDMKKSYTYYLAGVLTGIIIGAGLAWIIGQSAETNRNYRPHQPISFDLEETPAAENTGSTAPESPKPVQTDSSATGDSLRHPVDTLSGNTYKVTVIQDTILPDDDSLQDGNEEDIVVMEDKLIAVENIPIYRSTTVRDPEAKKPVKNLDSLLIDDKYTRQKAPESLAVEYWKSPFNYTGYRRINNRLILFGLSRDDSIRVYEKESRLFMHIRDKDFPLNETDKFRSIWFEQ